jgi:hypothetical protein
MFWVEIRRLSSYFNNDDLLDWTNINILNLISSFWNVFYYLFGKILLKSSANLMRNLNSAWKIYFFVDSKIISFWNLWRKYNFQLKITISHFDAFYCLSSTLY